MKLLVEQATAAAWRGGVRPVGFVVVVVAVLVEVMMLVEPAADVEEECKFG